MAVLVISILALVATAVGVYYSRGQLREAKKVREDNRRLIEDQQREDDLWSDKYVKAGKLLCRIADMDRIGMKVHFLGGTLGMLFGEDVRKHILGLLIEQRTRPLTAASWRPLRRFPDHVLVLVKHD
jgi:hypothetical protein